MASTFLGFHKADQQEHDPFNRSFDHKLSNTHESEKSKKHPVCQPQDDDADSSTTDSLGGTLLTRIIRKLPGTHGEEARGIGDPFEEEDNTSSHSPLEQDLHRHELSDIHQEEAAVALGERVPEPSPLTTSLPEDDVTDGTESTDPAMDRNGAEKKVFILGKVFSIFKKKESMEASQLTELKKDIKQLVKKEESYRKLIVKEQHTVFAHLTEEKAAAYKKMRRK